MIGVINRNASHEKTKPNKLTRYYEILEILGNKEMTAREIAYEYAESKNIMPDMNLVRPRITELVKEYHEIIECGSKYEAETNRNTTLYRKATEQEKMELDNMDHIPRID